MPSERSWFPCTVVTVLAFSVSASAQEAVPFDADADVEVTSPIEIFEFPGGGGPAE